MSNTEIGAIKNLLQETAKSLKGHARRLFMARTVKDVFEGVTYRAEQELGWNRATISKGLHELSSGIECADGRKGLTGRKPAEAHLPNLRGDIRELVPKQASFPVASADPPATTGGSPSTILHVTQATRPVVPVRATCRDGVSALSLRKPRLFWA